MKLRKHCLSLTATFVAVPVMALLLCLNPLAAAAQTSIGIYSSSSGTVCTLSDPGPVLIEAYVVVRPGGAGSAGVQFAAPKPGCFSATYMGDVDAPEILKIGNSQTGISIALSGCRSAPMHVLTIQYFGSGGTPTCCPYPIVNDPSVSDVLNVDCLFNEEPATAIVSYINPDATCECGGNSPPNKPDQPNPVSGAVNVSVSTSLSWFASDIDNNLAEFDVYLGTDPSPPLVATVTEMSYTPPAPLTELATHYWRVVARDTKGLETSSDPWVFTTRAANSPPSAPYAPEPFNGAVAIPVNVMLGWQCEDIDGDTLVYDVYLGTAMNPPLLAADVPNNYFTPPGLTAGVKYYWRIVARDPLGLEQSSPTWNFTTRLDNYPPSQPGNPSPANNAVGVPIDLTVSWTATDLDGDTLTYDLYFGTASNPPLLVAGLPSPSYHLPMLLEKVQYYWKVVVHDQHTFTSGPVWTFKTEGPNSPPAVPSVPSPADASTNVSVLATLGWLCSDPDGDFLLYDVYFGDTSPPPLAVSNVTSRSYNPGKMNFTTPYYWRIVARDIYGNETSGPEWSFVTKANSPPNAPSNPVPQNNTATGLAPLLRWSGSDPDGDALTYDLYFGSSTNPPLAVSGLTQSSYQIGTLTEGTYYWRVVAHDPQYETSGPVWSFQAVQYTGGTGAVEIWADPFRSDCSLSDMGGLVTIINAYVFMRIDAGGATGVQFAAPAPGCFAGIWVGDLIPQPFLAIGNSQSGISMAFTSCLMATTPILTVQYLGLGTTPLCCNYPVVPAPNTAGVIMVDCNFTETLVQGGSAVINEEYWCYCGALTPVLFSKFGASALDEGVSVEWELSGDEVATRYTLMRREGDATQSSTVTSGPLAGVTGSYLDATVEPGTTYHYELLVRTADGNEFRSPVATVTTQSVELTLGQNHPNPFNPTTVIPYVLPNGSTPVRVRLLIMDVSGAVVRTLVDENQAGGRREVVWDGRDDRGSPVSTGIYFSVLDADGKRRTRKMVLLK